MNVRAEPSLAGKVVLVTRPRLQAKALCSLITRRGGKALSLPTIEIEAPANRELCRKPPDYWSEFDSVIFISRNAVIWAFETIINRPSDLEDLNIIAIGAGSAEELMNRGITRISHAGPDAGSEALINLPRLQAARIKARRILIVKGEGGRSMLQNSLANRGAIVETVSVYKRIMPVYESGYLLDIWRKSKPDVVVVTSNEGLKNLLRLTPQSVCDRLLNSAVVAMSERTLKLATRLGFKSTICIVNKKSDFGLLQALYQIDREE